MKARYFIMLAILAAVFCLIQLSLNTRSATRQRDTILQKDLAAQPVAADIKQLTDFVHSHMRANIKFELSPSYERALAAAQPTVNGAVYDQAQTACSGRSDSITQARCVTDFVSKRLPPASPPVIMPDRSKFVYDIHSPLWAPDLAGLGLLVTVISIFTAAALKIIRPTA